MGLKLNQIFDALLPVRVGPDQLVYSVGRIARFPGYLVGRDSAGNGCLLISVANPPGYRQAPIRLEHLEVEFEVRSRFTEESQSSEGTFTVLRCRSKDSEVIRYFFGIAEAVIQILGIQPTKAAISEAVIQFSRIFQRLIAPPLRSVVGLFGELFLIRQARNPIKALASWRVQDSSRFDFTAGDLRLDVKATSGRSRVHTLTYDQCNSPAGTSAFLASLFVEMTPTGPSLQELVEKVEAVVSGRSELVIKLYETVAATLGTNLRESMKVRFDDKLAASSLRFFDLRLVPAIRSALPSGVSDLNFRSDLSNSPEMSVVALIDRDPAIEDFLP
jgi:Putative  PD-(D/E)XK family member, (DUF4420)